MFAIMEQMTWETLPQKEELSPAPKLKTAATLYGLPPTPPKKPSVLTTDGFDAWQRGGIDAAVLEQGTFGQQALPQQITDQFRLDLGRLI
jgi:hypothetical protein